MMAYKLLREKYPDTGNVKINWVNESKESLLPYDFEICFPDGIVKWCEVKTRTKVDKEISQWIISPNELQYALDDRYTSEFFCILFQIEFDGSVISSANYHMIGDKIGLWQYVRQCDAAHFVVQLY